MLPAGGDSVFSSDCACDTASGSMLVPLLDVILPSVSRTPIDRLGSVGSGAITASTLTVCIPNVLVRSGEGVSKFGL